MASRHWPYIMKASLIGGCSPGCCAITQAELGLLRSAVAAPTIDSGQKENAATTVFLKANKNAATQSESLNDSDVNSLQP